LPISVNALLKKKSGKNRIRNHHCTSKTAEKSRLSLNRQALF